jgi:hypothetical protein
VQAEAQLTRARQNTELASLFELYKTLGRWFDGA